jgi:hypothetical protein
MSKKLSASDTRTALFLAFKLVAVLTVFCGQWCTAAQWVYIYSLGCTSRSANYLLAHHLGMTDEDNKGCHHTILMMHLVVLTTDNSNSERAGELEEAPPVSLEKELVGGHFTV